MWLPFAIFSLVVVVITGRSLDGILKFNLYELPERPSVVIPQGTVVGSLSSNRNYAEFYGIPYADATSGSNRFKAPKPAPSFKGTFVANRKNIKCIRALETGYEGTEDCLVANVFTPTLDSTEKLSVMVWVKGKEFDEVNEREQPFGIFVEKNVVIVSLNYRESILGFLCLGTETAPGNAGLKDIVVGLKWVKHNIARFGGNPDDITLVGYGTSAAAVDLVTMSPMANGLVNKVIAQNGNAFTPWTVPNDNLGYAIQVSQALGHSITNIEDLSEIFKRTSLAALMGVINDLGLTDNFSPCIERKSLKGSEPFLVKSPHDILKDGGFLQIPFIIGYVDNESVIKTEKALKNDWIYKVDESFNELQQPALEFFNSQEQTKVAQRTKTFYLQNSPNEEELIDNYISYHSDTLIAAWKEVYLRVAASDSPVYLYQFSSKGSLRQPFSSLSEDNAAYSNDLAYKIFDRFDRDNNQILNKDLVISHILVERWTNFAKSGVPMSETSQVLWHPFTSNQPFHHHFFDDSEITDKTTLGEHMQHPPQSTMTFWDEVFAEHFLDAEGNRDWTERNQNEGSENEIEEFSAEGSGDGEVESNFATTATGYTFLIITFFTILSKFHFFQILS